MSKIQAEVEWILHLDSHEVRVAKPFANGDGVFCRSVEIGGQTWTAAAFARAPGKIGAESAWHPGTFRAWGETTARMHLSATTYRPGRHFRSEWRKFLPAHRPDSKEEQAAQEKLSTLVARIAAMANPQSQFGIIHSDLHFWNFSIDGDNLTVFDFDNCEYHWFLADLGTITFEASTCIHQRRPRQEFIADFMREFLSGYRAVRDSGELLACLPDFAKLREIQIFLTLSRRWKNREVGPFQKAFFNTIREAVLTERPFIETETMKTILNFPR